jgi:hypothetical protein
VLSGRIRFVGLLTLVTLGLAACGQDAHYTLTWRFSTEAPAAFSARSCGLAGVESFEGTEIEVDGTTNTFKAVCGAGRLERSLGPGTWTVKLQGVDPSGRAPTDGTATSMVLTGVSSPFVLELNQPSPVVEVVVVSRPSCADGIDNNSNGLVDSDDPFCAAGGPGERPVTRPDASADASM